MPNFKGMALGNPKTIPITLMQINNADTIGIFLQKTNSPANILL